MDLVAKKFSNFFQNSRFKSSYKPIILQSKLFNIKKCKYKEQNDCFIISIDNISAFFLKFNFILYQRFKIRQLRSKTQDVEIYKIIKRFYPNCQYKRLKRKDLNPNVLFEVKKLLFRYVLFLLRNDVYFYDFCGYNETTFQLQPNINREKQFKALIDFKEIYYITIPLKFIKYIQLNLPILEKATLGMCTYFLEGINIIPKLYKKLLVAAESFHEKRNISRKDKLKIYEFQSNECFYCGHNMKKKRVTDHFIPYDYIFESPIWNMVGACSNCNQIKSDNLIPLNYLNKIQKRNQNESFQSKFITHFKQYNGNLTLINEDLKRLYYNCANYFNTLNNFDEKIQKIQ